MTMQRHWAATILGRSFRASLTVLCLAGGLSAAEAGAAAKRFAQGVDQYNKKQYAEAARQLDGLSGNLPDLVDYVAYYEAAASVELKDYARARKDLAPLLQFPHASPVLGKGIILAARTLKELNAAEDAIRLLRERYSALPQPTGDLVMGDTFVAAGQLPMAVQYYQRVYYGYPGTDAAATAAAQLASLKETLGDSYPPVTAQQMLARAGKLFASKAYADARKEYSALSGLLGGPEGDLVGVRIGAVDYARGQTSAAVRYLKALHVDAPDADAERLYYLVESYRRLSDDDAMAAALTELERSYPKSPWRMKALISAGNKYLLINQTEQYEPLYRACAESFQDDPDSYLCQWKVAWLAYLQRRSDAASLLREHLVRYPESIKASAALYYLGRLAESAKNYGEAKAFFMQITERYRGHYYGVLAGDRLDQKVFQRTAPSPQTLRFLESVSLPPRHVPESYERTAATKWYAHRAEILESAGLHDLAEAELRFGARNGGQPHLLALDLARSAPSPFRAMRYMKSLFSDYLSLSLDEAPQEFWEYLFPLPYRNEILRATAATDLDPAIFAGLIRQESEFDPKAVSRARALGLAQIRPSTGRALARRAGIRRFSTRMLFQPAIKLQLGTMEFRRNLDEWDGKVEETLASYNAGKSRVLEWVTWSEFREPSEFVETIPFTETREYVQAVLRNAAIYKSLYGQRLATSGEKKQQKVPAAANRRARSSRKG
jgi:peptidoglycan lytic transglycosylase